MREERCVCCGAIIPEGRQVCINCETRGTQQERDEKNERRNTSIFQKLLDEAKRNDIKVQVLINQNAREDSVGIVFKSRDGDAACATVSRRRR